MTIFDKGCYNYKRKGYLKFVPLTFDDVNITVTKDARAYYRDNMI
jgi:hypothetical protein